MPHKLLITCTQTVTLAALNAGQPLNNVRSLRVVKNEYDTCHIQLDQQLMSNLVRLYWGPSCSLPTGYAEIVFVAHTHLIEIV
mgnify:CR=1 FL=1